MTRTPETNKTNVANIVVKVPILFGILRLNKNSVC
jgi:hypothetical protein